VACFCERGDLLSQWRGYPRDGGGYSLGFRDSVVMSANPPPKIIYDVETQHEIIRAMLSPVVETIIAHSGVSDATVDDFLSRISQQVRYMLIECGFCFKHPAFAEEAEWRIVRLAHKQSVQGSDGGPTVHLRPSATGLRPYTTIDLEQAEAESNERALARVIVGPARHPDLAEKAAERLLSNAGYQGVDSIVQRSEVPLRV
jgi:hypothetical protein